MTGLTHPSSAELRGVGGAPRVVGLRARIATVGVVAPALVVSRLLVLVSGMVGVLTLTPHAPARTVATSRAALGPVGHLLAASVDRFDAGSYLAIAQHGYGAGASPRLAFLPLYPLLIRIASVFTRSAVVAGVLVSMLAFAAALEMLRRLTELELGRRAADATVLLLCFAPLTLFFTAVYTESLFLALSVGTFYAARQGRWRQACALAALATLTRPTGVVLIAPLVIIWWRERRADRRALAWLVLVPVALVGWMGVLALAGHGPMSEFHAEQASWSRLTTTPIEGLLLALLAMGRGIVYVAGGGLIYHPTIDGPFKAFAQDVILGGILIGCLVGVEACRRRMAPEYFVYSGLVILMCLSSPEQGEPLWSFDRFALTIFPLWMAAGAFLGRRRLVAPAVALGAVAIVFYTMQFSSWAFVA